MGAKLSSPWKLCREVYHHLLVTANLPNRIEKMQYREERVMNALLFLEDIESPSVYPAKSRIVAIIYATMIEQIYGEEFYETLNDPELMGQEDMFFVPYLDDMETYDAILDWLKYIPNWIELGRAPEAVRQFYERYTSQGAERLHPNNM